MRFVAARIFGQQRAQQLWVNQSVMKPNKTSLYSESRPQFSSWFFESLLSCPFLSQLSFSSAQLHEKRAHFVLYPVSLLPMHIAACHCKAPLPSPFFQDCAVESTNGSSRLEGLGMAIRWL